MEDEARVNTTPIPVRIGDVIQVSPNASVNAAFHFKLATVDDVRAWGVIAYVATFEGDAYARLAWGSFEVIGPAAFVRSESLAPKGSV